MVFGREDECRVCLLHGFESRVHLRSSGVLRSRKVIRQTGPLWTRAACSLRAAAFSLRAAAMSAPRIALAAGLFRLWGSDRSGFGIGVGPGSTRSPPNALEWTGQNDGTGVPH